MRAAEPTASGAAPVSEAEQLQAMGLPADAASPLRADGSRNPIHPADVTGRFWRLRQVAFAVLVAIYLALPLIPIGGHPAIHLDVALRRFYLFGHIFNAQDVWLLFFLLSAVGWSLIMVTTLLGRVWCGYACPQTVFLEGVYRRIERWIEGPRLARIRRNRHSWDFSKLWRKVFKHALFIVISFLIAHAFLAYFVSLPSLGRMLVEGPSRHCAAFLWSVITAGALYFNFAWFREQLCLIICPYGRLQSAITDEDSLVVGYDAKRGEPRGKARDGSKGDCIDCGRCVAVCPTGIDIRNGLQLDCIACSACIDACDDIMQKVGRPTGLVRYDSQRGFETTKRRILRPRVWFYGGLGLVGLLALGAALTRYETLDAALLRATSTAYVLEGDEVRNLFSLHLVNKREDTRQCTVSARAAETLRVVIPNADAAVPPLASRKVPVLVTGRLASMPHDARLTVSVLCDEGALERKLDAALMRP